MRKLTLGVVVTCALFVFGAQSSNSQQKAASTTVQTHMVITDQAVREDSELAVLRPENIQVKQGKDSLKVNTLLPARGDNAALQLFILIDDTCDTGIGNNLNDLRDFINAQPATTVVGVAYMSNATIQVVQNFTADHALAAKAVRLPRGSLAAMDSPYLSLISLVNGWPEQNVRREVLMITDGIDRLRGERTSSFPSPTRGRTPSSRGSSQTMAPTVSQNTMPTMSIDADRASTTSQRYKVIVHSIYATGVGRAGRNAWEAQLGQAGIAKIADETGGEYFALGTQNAVSFKPYLDRMQRIFENQYYLVFQAVPRQKAGLQRVNITTDQANAEIAAADNVWVPAAE